MIQPKTIRDLFSFPGFQALTTLQEVPEDPGARVITLRRRQKKVPAPVVAMFSEAFTIAWSTVSGIFLEGAFGSGLTLSIAGSFATGARL
jgi:hypothetical protein